MIERYTTKKMQAIWTEEAKYNAFLQIELMNAEALHKQGIVTTAELALLKANASFSIPLIHELEESLKHDVIAFTRAVSKSLGPEKRFIHYGLTSTDVVDTAYGLLFKQANALIRADILRFMEVLHQKALLYKNTMTIGRTHGIHADITSFGLKFALWYSEMKRHLVRFQQASKDIEVGKISGAVGNYAFIDPFIEQYVLERLGLGRVEISTQTLQRDRHAFYITTLALIGATLEKIATEIRHLMRTEVQEVSEPFSSGQKGSSAMPHKKNPISSENICGLSRVLRGYCVPAMESVALWHERDISHSSVERIIMPDATSLLDYMLQRYTTTLDGLVVYEDKMLAQINATQGVIYSQRVLTLLLEKGWSREQAYDHIQVIAMQAMTLQVDFQSLLKSDPLVKSILSFEEINSCFTLDFYTRHVDYIYSQVFTN
jgi:adenylosuccinate lyase